MNKILNSLIKIYFIKSIVAGILIGMAGIISAQYNHPEIIFPVGLICIILSGNLLYTGCIGHFNIKEKYKALLCILLGNFVGVVLTLYYAHYYMDFILFQNIIIYKENVDIIKYFISSIFCGMLMCTATSLNKDKNIIVVIMCVAAFIIGKFEHSIANMFYLGINGYSLKDILLILIAIIGNAIGSKIIHPIERIKVV